MCRPPDVDCTDTTLKDEYVEDLNFRSMPAVRNADNLGAHFRAREVSPLTWNAAPASNLFMSKRPSGWQQRADSMRFAGPDTSFPSPFRAWSGKQANQNCPRRAFPINRRNSKYLFELANVLIVSIDA